MADKIQVELTQDQYNQLQGLLEKDSAKISLITDLVGQNVFLRTVTYHALGTVKQVVGNFVELENASWVADSGRFNEFLKGASPNENEPITGRFFVNLDTVVDFTVGVNPVSEII